MDTYKTIFEIIILPLLGILTSYLVAYIKAKRDSYVATMENETYAKYINMLVDTVTACVVATNQTYVETLKKQGKFDLEAQKIAFEKTKDAVLDLLNIEAKEYLLAVVDDLDAYINNQIEVAVNLNK